MPEHWWHIEFRDGSTTDAWLDFRPLSRDGGEWFVFNPRGLRKAVEMAGWTVEAQTGILADKTRRDWKHRVGLRGRACAILART
jgi:hypothetical protein